MSIPLDVTDEDAVRRAFTGIERIDHLITAAAGTLRGRLIDLDTQRARELFDTKFWGQHHCIKYAASRMAAGGSVVLFSGWISRKPAVEMSTLAAVDGAIEALARTLALFDTPLWRSRLSETRRGLISIALRVPIQWGASEPPMTSPKRSFSS